MNKPEPSPAIEPAHPVGQEQSAQQDQGTQQEQGAQQEQGLISHLIELRTRLLRSVFAVLAVFIVLLPFAQKLYSWLAAPLLSRLPAGAHLIAIDVSSPFLVPVETCFYTSLLLAMPMVIYQLWAFVAPGLYRHEQRLAVPLLVSATVLFYTGCAFAYFVVLPMAFRFLVQVTPVGVSMMTDIRHYLDFVGVMFIAFGASFELPVAVVILVLLGWVSLAQLRSARRYAIVGNFVIAAVITPPDVVSMLMLAIPLCLLYEAGLLAARMLARREAAAA
ncbi:MAG TPA: twin-arginine translocase subunit TatC [Xanthomonadaceae bacterium]|nr:twin-arginine translocase subunit TatC [Xanthomonadaceae bacterium]